MELIILTRLRFWYTCTNKNAVFDIFVASCHYMGKTFAAEYCKKQLWRRCYHNFQCDIIVGAVLFDSM